MLGLEFSLSHFWIKPNFYNKFHPRGFFSGFKNKVVPQIRLNLEQLFLEVLQIFGRQFFGVLIISGGKKNQSHQNVWGVHIQEIQETFLKQGSP